MQTKQLAVFVSGNGTNCENLIRHFSNSNIARVALVLSSSAKAYALQRAERWQVPTVAMSREAFNNPAELLPLLAEHNIHCIVLAGFLRVIPDFLLEAFPQRIINIHPSLLPKFGGKGMWGHHVHEAVKAAGETETGMTVHLVSSEIDGGEIIAQFSTPLLPTDSADDIATKEHELEMTHFPAVVEKWVSKF